MTHLSISATHGVYAGALQFILALAIYLVNMNLFVEWWYGLIGLGLSVFFMFSGTVAARKAGGEERWRRVPLPWVGPVQAARASWAVGLGCGAGFGIGRL